MAANSDSGRVASATEAMAANSAALFRSAGQAAQYGPLGEKEERDVAIGTFNNNTAIPLPREILEWWYRAGDRTVDGLGHVKLRRETPPVALANADVSAYNVGIGGGPVVLPPSSSSHRHRRSRDKKGKSPEIATTARRREETPVPGVPLSWADHTKPPPPIDAMTAELSAVRIYNVQTRLPIREPSEPSPSPSPPPSSPESPPTLPLGAETQSLLPPRMLVDGNGHSVPVDMPTRGSYFAAITHTQDHSRTAFQLNFNPFTLNRENEDPFFLGRPAAWSKYFVVGGYSNAGYFEVPKTNVGGAKQVPMPFIWFHDHRGDDAMSNGNSNGNHGTNTNREGGTRTRKPAVPLSRLDGSGEESHFPSFEYHSPSRAQRPGSDANTDQPKRAAGLTISEYAILTGNYRAWTRLNMAMHMVKGHLDRHRIEVAATKYVNFVSEFLPHFKDLGILDDGAYIDEEKLYFGKPCEREPGLYVAHADKVSFWHRLYNLTHRLLCEQAALAGLVITGTHMETDFGIPPSTRIDTALAGQMYRRADMMPEAWWPHNATVDEDWTNYFNYWLSGGGAGNLSGRMLEVITGLNIEELNKLMFRNSSAENSKGKEEKEEEEESFDWCFNERKQDVNIDDHVDFDSDSGGEDFPEDWDHAVSDKDKEGVEDVDAESDGDGSDDDDDDDDGRSDGSKGSEGDGGASEDESEEEDRDATPRPACSMATVRAGKRKRDDAEDDDDVKAMLEAVSSKRPSKPDVATFHAIDHVRRVMIKLYCALFGESGPPRKSAETILNSARFMDLLLMADRCLRDFRQMGGDILTERPLLDKEIYDRPTGLEYRPTLDRYSV